MVEEKKHNQMKETEVKTFAELHAIIEQYDARAVIYRGVKSVDFPLIPKIGRIVPPDLAKADEMDKILIPNSIRLTLKKPLISTALTASHSSRDPIAWQRISSGCSRWLLKPITDFSSL